MHDIPNQVKSILEQAVTDRVFPGVAVGVIKNGKLHLQAVGRFTYDTSSPAVLPDTIYDIASVTKSIPTNMLVLKLVEQNLLSLEDLAIKYIPELQNAHREDITIRHLLTYTVTLNLDNGLSSIAREGTQKIWDTIFNTELHAPPGEEYYYTNTPSLLLGLIIERITQKPLDVLAQELFFTPLGMHQTTFHPTQPTPPTEIDERGTVQGTPHDETAWTLRSDGIVAGNAGLFSTTHDLLTFVQMLLQNGTYNDQQFFDSNTVKSMCTNQLAHLGVSCGLGWEVNQPHFMGAYSNDHMFGKTGFTGCCVIADPEKQCALAILSNRTYPKRPTTPGPMNQVRRAIADLVFA